MKKTSKGLPKFENEVELANFIYEDILYNTGISYSHIDTKYRFMYGNNQLDLLDISFEKFLDLYITNMNVALRNFMMDNETLRTPYDR